VAAVASPLAGGISGDAALHGNTHASDAESQPRGPVLGWLAALALGVAASQWQTVIVALVVGVLLAPVLIELEPALVRAVAPGGTLILSGTLDTTEKSVYEAFVPEHLALGRRTEREGWVTFVWRKPV
jgi:Ribosomal protein L11 methyltransferase (PrmA)